MSCNYADGLSPYHDKGQLGLDEKFDSSNVIPIKVTMLAKWINKAKHVVIHTGAGISTSAGIPDFRGPKGVWTLQEKGLKPDISTDFNEAIPTPTHMAIARLVDSGKVKYVVSQNIDGLHLRSGLNRSHLSELHGNMFVEQCGNCSRQFVRNKAAPSVGQKSLGKPCPTIKPNGRQCRGRLHDTILDWEHNLPENDLAMADFHSCMADLSIAIGTTMQIVPSGSLPLYTKKAGGKLVIINLQPTKHDAKADLIIHGYADKVMTLLMKQLSLRIPKYSPAKDYTRAAKPTLEWTISDETTAKMRKIYEAKCGTKEAKKRLEIIDDDDVPLITRITSSGGRKRKSDGESSSPKKSRRDKDEDSDLEVVEEIPKSRRGRPRKNAQTTPPAPTPTKLIIKKNVTPSKTKYEIIPTRASKKKVKLVYNSDPNATNDLEMICESDDEGPIVFTTNFRRYLHDDKTFNREVKAEEGESKKIKHEEGELLARDILTEIINGITGYVEPEPCPEIPKEEEAKKEENSEIQENTEKNTETTETGESSDAQTIANENSGAPDAENNSAVVAVEASNVENAEDVQTNGTDPENSSKLNDVANTEGDSEKMEVDTGAESTPNNPTDNTESQVNSESNDNRMEVDEHPVTETNTETHESPENVRNDAELVEVVSNRENESQGVMEKGESEDIELRLEENKEASESNDNSAAFSTSDNIVSQLDLLCSNLP